MCVIIYSPTGDIPVGQLREALARNADGWGYVLIRKKPVVRKGMTAKQFWAQWKSDTEGKKPCSVVFHARIGTSGHRNETNCHPFPIPGGWLFHNGVLSDWTPDNDSPINDTQIFIRDIVKGLGEARLWVGHPSIIKLMESAVGGSKFVVVTKQGDVTIIGEHRGFWHQERWYSNSTCFPKSQPATEFVQGGRSIYDMIDWRRGG